MTHFLGNNVHERRTRGIRAGVRVAFERFQGVSSLTLVEEGGILTLKEGIGMTELPAKMVVMASNGDVLRPSSKFWVSTETIDPFHILIDNEAP